MLMLEEDAAELLRKLRSALAPLTLDCICADDDYHRYRASRQLRPKGASINDVHNIFGIFDPLPLVHILAGSIKLKSHNLPYYVCFWANPLPLCADVFYEWSLT